MNIVQAVKALADGKMVARLPRWMDRPVVFRLKGDRIELGVGELTAQGVICDVVWEGCFGLTSVDYVVLDGTPYVWKPSELRQVPKEGD